MKVLQICAAYKPAFIYGGPTMSVSMLSEQLSLAGTYTKVFTTTANGKEELKFPTGEKLDVDGVPVTYFKRITKDHTHFSPALLKTLWQEVKKFDVVHIHAWWNLVSLFSCLIALLQGVTVIVSPRGTLSAYSFNSKNEKVKWLIHKLLGKALLKKCHFHVTSPQEAAAIKTLTKSRSVTMIPNFVKLRSDISSVGYNPGEVFKFIFLSRIEEKKGLDLLIKALPLINFKYSLTIAGGGEEAYTNSLKNLAQNNSSASNITWLGFQQENKFDVLAGHDLLILPSHDENFGNVVIESLSEGTAVLVSRFVGLADYVTENDLGWSCNISPAAIASTLNIIKDKKEKLALIRQKAPEQIRKDFNEHGLVKRYIKLYNDILREK